MRNIASTSIIKIGTRPWNRGKIKLDKTPPAIVILSRKPEDDVLPSQSVDISVNVTDSLSGVENVTLYYTLDNGTTWIQVPMNHKFSANIYEATIPGQPLGTWVRYKIVALIMRGIWLHWKKWNPTASIK